ncbi:MAG: DUF134 domain-containing protein [Promethearchaeota archaeon]|nr:MAG: DUF134 domain-containing protein [Candidatus Lokiarchaeota archaeon]
MGRRTRMRYVKRTPNNFYFADMPESGINSDNFIILTISEFEAMRLKHYRNLNQKEAAETMGVSQPTFSRILDSAHQKATKALIEGKTIRVYGGNVNFKESFRGYGCLDCDAEWRDDNASKGTKVHCPECNSTNVYFLVKEPI